MDSITQFALGATVGLALLGRKTGPRKSVLIGGILGTLPDLDVLIPLGDPIDDFIYHRGPSHSLVVQAAATPLIGEALRLLVKSLRDHRILTWLAVYLVLSTHALLDAMTVYGTRILWPWPTDPFGVGSLFIIDPLYSIPLLVAMITALGTKIWARKLARTAVLALVISTAYAAWSIAAKSIALHHAGAALREQGIDHQRIMATPTPFNTMFWKAIAIDGSRYHNVYVSILSGNTQIHSHNRGAGSLDCLAQFERAGQLRDFAGGFVKSEVREGQLVVSDLRMGVTPSYAFAFAIAADRGAGFEAIQTEQLRSNRSVTDDDRRWLWAGMIGNVRSRKAEASSRTDTGEVGRGGQTVPRC